MNYICKQCGNTYKAAPNIIKCECGAALWLDFEGQLTKDDIIQSEHSLWRYSKALPVKLKDVTVSFGEGMTPLARIDYKGYKVQVKQDNLMPTGSFKDRGVVMVSNFMKNMGVNCFAEDSSGNGGSSFAGYCALGGIDIKIFVPAGTSAGKIAQMKVYGADLVEVEGTRQDVADQAMKNIGGSVYVGHNWHPLFIQGTKTVAYELWEQNGFKAPDNVVCVAGNGSMVAGVYIGFMDLFKSGEIEKMPRIFGIQSEGCNPFYRDFVGQSLDFELTPSIAEGIRIKKSTKHDEVLKFVKETGGAFISVKEKAIKEALFEIGKYGFYIEPTSATGFAGLNKLIEVKMIQPEETTSVLVSGNGLKATGKIMDLMD